MIINIFIDLLNEIDKGETIAAAVGAVLGALGAFAASQGHFILAHRHDRWEEHRESLIRLELVLNEYLDMAYVNIGVMTRFQSIGEMVSRKKVFWGAPSQLPIEKAFLPLLQNSVLKNKIFSFYVKTRKVNHDIETAFESYEKIKDAFIKREIELDQYKVTTLQLIDWSSRSIQAHRLLIDLVKELLAIVKVLLIEDRPYKIIAHMKKKRSFKFEDSDIVHKRTELNKEIEEIAKASKSKVEEYLGPE